MTLSSFLSKRTSPPCAGIGLARICSPSAGRASPLSPGLLLRSNAKELAFPPWQAVDQPLGTPGPLTPWVSSKGKEKQGQFLGVNKIHPLSDLALCVDKE